MMDQNIPPWIVELLVKIGALEAKVDTLQGDVNGILNRERNHLSSPAGGSNGATRKRDVVRQYAPVSWGSMGVGVAVTVVVEKLFGGLI